MSQRYLGGIITANPTTPTMTSESGVWTLEQQFQYSNVWSPKIVGNSVRFRSSASAYLSRTPSVAGNRTTFTWSGWVKRGDIGATYKRLFDAGASNDTFMFNSDNTLTLWLNGAAGANVQTTQVFRDVSAWYHLMFAIDTTQATASNRIKIYVNGTQVTAFAAASYPTQNYNCVYYNTATQHDIGAYGAGTQSFDGYMAEINFVDGQALTPSSFGAYDSTGVWQPLPYTGTYGTNGFYLTFADNSAATAAALGKDYSGNGNNWTPNNISLTAGVTYDWMLDSPTNSDNGGTGRGNCCVANPLAKGSGCTVSNGNLSVAWSIGRQHTNSTFQIPSSGKWYWEVYVTTNTNGNLTFGVSPDTFAPDSGYVGDSSTSYGLAPGQAGATTMRKVTNNTFTAWGANTTGFGVGITFGVAYDADAGSIYFRDATGWMNASNSNDSQPTTAAFTGITGNQFPAFGHYSGATSATQQDANFGQRPFSYTPPTGFKALNTQNLPDPNITNGAQYMAATTYTGTGSSLSVSNGNNNTTGVTFKPDFIWIKDRSNARSNVLQNSVTGAAQYLISDSTNAEATSSSGVTAINSNGFTVGTQLTWNGSAETYVAWQWQAGQGTTSSNTSGSITSTVSVNTKAGFSVVTFNSTSASGTSTIGHGLGVKPAMLIMKDRTQAYGWDVWNKGLGAISNTLILQSTAAVSTTRQPFTTTEPTSTVFSFNNTFYAASNDNIVVYAWAEVAGYSAFGSYTGNGSTDGPFVYCGFRPRFLLLKVSSTTGDWVIYDTSRNTYNVMDLYLYPDSSAAEAGSGTPRVDALSNGFKLRNTGQDNTSSATYIYAAFAENPFKIARAR